MYRVVAGVFPFSRLSSNFTDRGQVMHESRLANLLDQRAFVPWHDIAVLCDEFIEVVEDA